MSEATVIRKEIKDFVRDWAKNRDWREEKLVAREMSKMSMQPDTPVIGDIEIWEHLFEGYEFDLDVTIRDVRYEIDSMYAGNAVHFEVQGRVFPNEETGDWDMDRLGVLPLVIELDFSFLESNDSEEISEPAKEPVTYTILEKCAKSADEALSYISKLAGDSWYRGHADEKWELRTGIARQKSPTPALERKLRLAFENQTNFLNTASHKYGAAEYTFMMQHHGLPTRLLDWTTSPLTALYFAVYHVLSDDKDSDACIWVMDPVQLNRQHNGASFPHEIDHTQGDKFTEEVQHKALAIHAPYTNLRMKAQQAEFTLHSGYEPLEKMKGAEVYLREKIIIPKAFKPELRSRLAVLGVTRAALFPDYDNIAKTIRDDILEGIVQAENGPNQGE